MNPNDLVMYPSTGDGDGVRGDGRGAVLHQVRDQVRDGLQGELTLSFSRCCFVQFFWTKPYPIFVEQ